MNSWGSRYFFDIVGGSIECVVFAEGNLVGVRKLRRYLFFVWVVFLGIYFLNMLVKIGKDSFKGCLLWF